jgi:adenylate cyclase
MATEIERKFWVVGDAWRGAADAGTRYVQGYLASGASGATVRVRLAGEAGWLTIKGPTVGLTRPEFEYAIPTADAEAMLQTLCTTPPIEKTRYTMTVGQHLWEIDVFAGVNAGLVMAEIELGSEGERFERPSWLGEELSDDPRFFNAALARHPYQSWVTS